MFGALQVRRTLPFAVRSIFKAWWQFTLQPSFAMDLVLRERVVTLGSADDAAAIAELASLLRTLLTDAVHESE